MSTPHTEIEIAITGPIDALSPLRERLRHHFDSL
jgi:hypothetical protein